MELLNPTRNVISDANSFVAKSPSGVFLSPETYAHNWTATNATVSVSSETYVHPLQYSLDVQPTGGDITISLASIIPTDTELNAKKVQFHCQIFAQVSSIATVTITNVTASTSSSHSQNMIANQWNGVFSPVIDVGVINTSVDDIEFAVSITIAGHSNFTLHMSVPTLMNEIGFAKNFFVYNMRKFLPTFIWDKDKIQEYPNYPFTKLLHVLSQQASKSATLYARFYEYLESNIGPRDSNKTWRYSQLLNPEYVDEDYMDWLSQFNGTPLRRSLVTTTSTNAIINEQDSVRWQLKHAYFGRNAGTKNAIKECVKQVLGGNKVVYITPGGSDFVINIYTIVSETPGVASEGDTSPEVVTIANQTKPMGFVLSHEAYDELPFILDDPIYGVLNTASLA